MRHLSIFKPLTYQASLLILSLCSSPQTSFLPSPNALALSRSLSGQFNHVEVVEWHLVAVTAKDKHVTLAIASGCVSVSRIGHITVHESCACLLHLVVVVRANPACLRVTYACLSALAH